METRGGNEFLIWMGVCYQLLPRANAKCILALMTWVSPNCPLVFNGLVKGTRARCPASARAMPKCEMEKAW